MITYVLISFNIKTYFGTNEIDDHYETKKYNGFNG